MVDYHKHKNIVFNQFLSLGDILFLIPLARHMQEQGHKVIWPVHKTYADIYRHFSDINFIPYETCGLNLERRDAYVSSLGFVIPFRWAEVVQRLPYKECMPAKYKLVGEDWRMWRKLYWARDYEKEKQLHVPGEYNFINHRFRADRSGWVPLKINNGLRNVELTAVPGFTLLDWAGVIQHATTIHTVSTSILYMLETMALLADEVAIYTRKPDENNLDFVKFLLTKDYKLYE